MLPLFATELVRLEDEVKELVGGDEVGYGMWVCYWARIKLSICVKERGRGKLTISLSDKKAIERNN